MSVRLVALYVGPDQVMPLVSILATIAGFVLIFWNKLLNLFRRIGRLFHRSSGTPEGETAGEKQTPPRT